MDLIPNLVTVKNQNHLLCVRETVMDILGFN
jgi:hypothetical protein